MSASQNKVMKKRILLTNSYAVNNGDLALVIALRNALVARGYAVAIATFYYDFLKEKYPDIPFIKELLDYKISGGTFIKRIFLSLNFLLNKMYREHDVFIASPGGYVNSYYGLKRCLLPLVQAKRISKKTAIYSQSIGPLNPRDRKLLTAFSSFIDVILVRDDYSRKCIASISCQSKVFQTKDAAFLIQPRRSAVDDNCKTVAVSVREWKYDNRDMQNFSEIIQTLCKRILEEGFNIEFISTCQGVDGYRDDSITATAIRNQLINTKPMYAEQISVNTAYHTYHELIERLNSRYTFTIGTRLHMCILSLINGTPAFNISYEVKGIECYKYLGLENYSVDFNEPVSQAIEKFNGFLANYKVIQSGLVDRLMPVHQESNESLTQFINEIEI